MFFCIRLVGVVALSVFVAACNNAALPVASQGVAVAAATDKALAELAKRATDGDPGAQFGLGNRYMNGAGVPRDVAEAVAWYQKSAAQGFHYAQVNLGNLYADGVGVPKDIAKAVEWYQIAAIQGDPLAQTSLGNLYWKGEGVVKDDAEAMRWFEKAAVQGVAEAQNFLAYGYRTGGGMDKDPASAVAWYKKAAAQGVENAQLNLGVIYLNGDGIRADSVLACAWFEIVAASTDPSWREQGAAERDIVVHKITATEIAEAGYEYLLRTVRPGIVECDLAIDVNFFMRGLGANDSFLMLNCGPRADAVMPSSERVIEVGDLLLCELSPSVAGQFTQVCRTVSIGAPSPTKPGGYALLVEAMREGIARVRPGGTVGDVCLAIDDHLSAAGFAQYSRPPFIRRRGHGLGCGSVAPGDVAVDNSTVLEPGMLFMVHPNQFLPDTGYMMCGEPVLVTETGNEILTRRQSALAVIEASAS